MAILGADPEQLHQLAAKFGEEASKIEATISMIGAQIGQTWWQGPDAESFRSQWEGTYTSQLRNVCSRLNEAAADCRRQAEAQRQVSST